MVYFEKNRVMNIFKELCESKFQNCQKCNYCVRFKLTLAKLILHYIEADFFILFVERYKEKIIFERRLFGEFQRLFEEFQWCFAAVVGRVFVLALCMNIQSQKWRLVSSNIHEFTDDMSDLLMHRAAFPWSGSSLSFMA